MRSTGARLRLKWRIGLEHTMFWMLAPGLALPVLTWMVFMWARRDQFESCCDPFSGLPLYATGITLIALFVSMTIRATMLVMHVDRGRSHYLPWANTLIHLASYGILIIWSLAATLQMPEVFGAVPGLALAVLACVEQERVARPRPWTRLLTTGTVEGVWPEPPMQRKGPPPQR